jgi:hypothetical protein
MPDAIADHSTCAGGLYRPLADRPGAHLTSVVIPNTGYLGGCGEDDRPVGGDGDGVQVAVSEPPAAGDVMQGRVVD